MTGTTNAGSSPAKAWVRGLSKALFVCFALLVAYVMSMGPAYWLVSHRVISQPSFNLVYYPLKPLTLKSRTFQRYLDFWGGP